MTERGLADARRTDEAQNRRFELVYTLLHGEVFQDAFLDLVEAIVIAFQHFFGVAQFIIHLGLFLPRQTDQGVDVIAHDGGFGRHRRHQLELAQFALRFFQGLFRHLGSDDLLFQLFQIGALFAFAQFLLNRLDLLVQIVFALRFFHLTLDAAADALLDLQNVEFAFQLAEQMLVPLGDVENFQDDLLLLKLQRQMRGNRVGQAAGIVNARQRSQDFRRNLFVEFDVLVELLNDGAAHRLDFRLIAGFRIDRGQIRHEMGIQFADVMNARALHALDQHLDSAVRQLQHLQNIGDAADFIDIVGRRFILGGSFLRGKHDALALLHGGFQRFDGLWASHEQRDHHMRKDDNIP